MRFYVDGKAREEKRQMSKVQQCLIQKGFIHDIL